MEQIKQSTLDFLADIKIHNEREWFAKNRSRYEAARADFETFIQGIIEKATSFDPILKGLEARNCTYRINRDIRFSNDKTIYKSHFGAFIVKGGKKNGDKFAGYYIHVEPEGKSMIAGGAYMPPTPWLTEIRTKISEEGDRFVKIIRNKDLVRFYGELEGERLKSPPRGFTKDHPHIELLKMKSFLVMRTLSDSQVTAPSFFDEVIEGCRIMKPLNDFLNDYQA